jgi:threonine dehydrogenase-like Zn-dependent dehydrogenase
VLVIGVGGVGGFVVAASRSRHPGALVALDVNESRLTTASSLGASHVLNARATDVLTDALAITDGEGFDVVVEASGAPASLATATSLVASGGTVLLLGLHHPPSSIHLHSLALREVSLLTSVAQINDVDVAAAAELLATTDLAATVLGEVVDLDDVVSGAIAPLAANAAPGKMIVRLP